MTPIKCTCHTNDVILMKIQAQISVKKRTLLTGLIINRADLDTAEFYQIRIRGSGGSQNQERKLSLDAIQDLE